MAKPLAGEVWQVDLGLAAKVRPCLVLSDYPRDEELALMLIVPHTTAIRGNRWEFPISKPFLGWGFPFATDPTGFAVEVGKQVW